MTSLEYSPDLEALRLDLAHFVRELGLEHYNHFSGQKERLEIAPIFERYGHLFSKDLAANCLERWNAAESEEEKRSYKHLFQFAFFGYVANLTKGLTESLAKSQREMSITVHGEEISYHSIMPRLTNEPEMGLRREIDEGMAGLEIELDAIRKESWDLTYGVFREFDYPSYREGCRHAFGVDYDRLAVGLKRFLEETDKGYVAVFDKIAEERLGYPISEAHRCDLAYLFRAETWDEHFPKEGMVERATSFLGGMGIPLKKVSAITLDVAEREKKRPRAFCSAVEMGKEVYVCTRPMGGLGDYLSFLHELGHAYHFAHTDSSLPAELILIGDSATSEVFAFNFHYLLSDGLWLRTHLGVEDPSPIVDFLLLQKLYFLRRYASKLLYELELHSDYRMEGKAELYTKHLNAGLKAHHRPEYWLGDLDPAFYSAGYLRAWIFEAQMRRHMKSELGEDWWGKPEAGERLREYWRTGRMYMPEEMAQRICGCELSLEPVLSEVNPSGK